MREDIVILKENAHQALLIAGRAADALGLECYVVGGYVRDLMSGKSNDDFDFVVVGSGIAVANKVAEMNKGCKVAQYENYGTASVHMDNGIELEFVGARREFYHRESRNPIVEDGTLMDDIMRRDFTMNAMAICVNSSNFGELVDYYFGMEDLKEGVIRCVGNADERFDEDPLRILRGVRFAGQMDASIEEFTFKAMNDARGRLSIITQERITAEIEKMFSRHPSVAFKYFFDLNLQEVALPYRKYQSTYQKEIALRAFGDMEKHFVTGFKAAMWTILLNGSSFSFRECAEKLKLSNDTLDDMTHLSELRALYDSLYFSGYGSEYFALNYRKFLNLCGRYFRDIPELLQAIVIINYNFMSKTYYGKLYDFEKMQEFNQYLLSIDIEERWTSYRPEHFGINGGAIMKQLGITTGSEVGLMKDHMNELVLTGMVHKSSAAAAFYLKHFAARDLKALKKQYDSK